MTDAASAAASTASDAAANATAAATGEPAKPSWKKRALKWAIAAAGFAVLAYFVRDLDAAALKASILDIDPVLGIAAAVVMLLGKVGMKVVRSQILLVEECRRIGVPAPTWRVTARLLVASHAAGQLAWGPLGFTVRTLALRDGGMPLLSVARVHVVERIAEAIGIATIAVAVLVIAPDAVLGSWFGRVLLGVLVTATIGGCIVMISRRLRSRLARHGLQRAGRALANSTIWAFLSSVADVGVLLLVASGMHVDLDLGTALLAFLAVNGACAVPVTPAQLGVQESAIVVVFTASGIGAPAALAVALAYRGAHVLPLVLVGVPALIATWMRRSPSRKS